MNKLVCWCGDWLTAHPKIKVTLSTAEGAFIGAIGSAVYGWVNGSDPFTLTGLKRAVGFGTTTAVAAVYNLYKTPPTQTAKETP